MHFLRLAGPERQADYPECCTAVARCHSFQGKRERMEERIRDGKGGGQAKEKEELLWGNAICNSVCLSKSVRVRDYKIQ